MSASWRAYTQYEPTVGYTFIPGVKARIPHQGGGYLIRVNGAGFRCDHEVAVERRTSRRALLFGDSFTAGDGVSNPDRYGDLLERADPSLEVLNFGIPGSCTGQQLLAYREFAKDLAHDLVLVGVFVENVTRVRARFRVYLDESQRRVVYAKPYFERGQDGQLLLRHVPVPRHPLKEHEIDPEQAEFVHRGAPLPTVYRAFRRLGLPDLGQKLSQFDPVPEYREPDHPSWLVMRAILQHWIEASPVPVLLIPIPYFPFVEGDADPSDYQARFQELARDTGCRLHDPLPDFTGYPPKERRGFRFKTDPHLTREGHRALADSLAPTVRRMLEQIEEGA